MHWISCSTIQPWEVHNISSNTEKLEVNKVRFRWSCCPHLEILMPASMISLMVICKQKHFQTFSEKVKNHVQIPPKYIQTVTQVTMVQKWAQYWYIMYGYPKSCGFYHPDVFELLEDSFTNHYQYDNKHKINNKLLFLCATWLVNLNALINFFCRFWWRTWRLTWSRVAISTCMPWLVLKTIKLNQI